MNTFLANLYLRSITVRDREEGQAMAEYGLIIGLVAVLLIGALVLFRQNLEGAFNAISNAI